MTEEEVYRAAHPTQGSGDLHALGTRMLVLWRAPGGHQARGETGLLAGVGQRERAEGSRAPAQGDGPPSLPGLSCVTKMVQTWMALRRAAFLCEQFAECSPVTRGPENKQRSLLFLVFN